MYYLLAKSSPFIEPDEAHCIRENLIKVTMNGRCESLKLQCAQEGAFDLKEACIKVFGDLESVAVILDESRGVTDFSEALKIVKRRLDDPNELPSERVAQAVEEMEFVDLVEKLSKEHKDYFMNLPLDASHMEAFVLESRNSEKKRQDLEENGLSYEEYLKKFMVFK